MSQKILKIVTFASVLLGFAGLGSALACCSYADNIRKDEESERSREFQKYVMEHPSEYEVYQDYEQMKNLQDENASLKNDLTSLRLENTKTSQQLKDLQASMEKAKPGFNIHFGL